MNRILLQLTVFIFTLNAFVFGIGTQFLSIPNTARELALGVNPALMGESFSNPAVSNSHVQNPDIFISHGSWIAGVTSTTIQFSKGTGGIQIRYSGISDLEFRTGIPTDNALAEFGAYGASFGGFYSKQIGNNYFGISLKGIGFQIYDESSYGYAADFGITKMFGEKLNVGLSVLNIGSMSVLSKTAPNLPVRILSGIRYQSSYKSWKNEVFLSLEKSSLNSGLIYRMGNEFTWQKIAIQAGTQLSEKVNSISGGIRLRLGMYSFQYGVQIGSQDLGLSQMLDFSVRLP